jgi:hypothetical protein
MASGDTLLTFHPYNNEPPATIYATLDLRNIHPVLDFDATVDEEAIFSAIMPRRYADGGVTVNIHYSMSSAEANNVVWQVAFERIGTVLDIDADGFTAFLSTGAVAVPGTSGIIGVA